MIYRALVQNLSEALVSGKVVVLLGPRQAGKTTIAKILVEQKKEPFLWLNGDEDDIQALLAEPTSTKLSHLIGHNRILVIDEAQNIPHAGRILKLIHDNLKDVWVFVTGSSAFELANHISEPLTGRKRLYHLYPLSFGEMVKEHGVLVEKRLLEQRLIYGYYPEVVSNPGKEKEVLRELSESYLYKDVFALGAVKKPQLLKKLLQALALQLGSEVNHHELGQMVGADNETIERYLDVLEKAFIIYRLPSLNRNVRNEIKKGKKVFFIDNGIRNSILKSFNPIPIRNDIVGLWENFAIVERLKFNEYQRNWINSFFWRTFSKQEIDYIEEKNGRLYAFELKWNPKIKKRIPKAFLEGYPNSETKFITPNNIEEFLLPEFN